MLLTFYIRRQKRAFSIRRSVYIKGNRFRRERSFIVLMTHRHDHLIFKNSLSISHLQNTRQPKNLRRTSKRVPQIKKLPIHRFYHRNLPHFHRVVERHRQNPKADPAFNHSIDPDPDQWGDRMDPQQSSNAKSTRKLAPLVQKEPVTYRRVRSECGLVGLSEWTITRQ